MLKAEELIVLLEGRWRIAAILLETLADSGREWLEESSLVTTVPAGCQSEAYSSLESLCSCGVFRRLGDRWASAVPSEQLLEMSHMLNGAQILSDVTEYRIRDTAPLVVLTQPVKPCRLHEAIRSHALKVRVEDTRDAFHFLAREARQRFIIMTPFLDNEGGEWALSLFETLAPQVAPILILRYLHCPHKAAYPKGFDAIRGKLAKKRVKVFDYAIQRQDGTMETFHAKTVCVDDRMAYVGSSNITQASRDFSMELGLVVRDVSAQQIIAIMERVLSIASPVDLAG